MPQSKNNSLRACAMKLLLSCAVYFLLDFPIRITGAYGFPVGIGIKCFLPFTYGIFLGPLGVLGGAVGSVFTGILTRTGAAECLAEFLCVLISGLGSHYGWFALNRDGRVRFERWREIGLYFAMTAVLSALCGGVTAAILGGALFFPTAVAYLLMGVLVGLNVGILLGGILCVAPVLPRWCVATDGIRIALSPAEATLDAVNEEIEFAALAQKIPMKRVFEIESCLEELYIRIHRSMPDADVYGSVKLGTTNSLRIWVPGEKYNPFRAEEGEDEMDLVSLKLLRHRALRASYTYTDGENLIQIVV